MRLRRFTLLFLTSLVGACAVLATPAPPPRPWVDGWKFVDPDGDCKLARHGDMLTIELPAAEHWLDPFVSINAPRLLQEVQGDFLVQVRVNGRGFLKKRRSTTERCACAGLFVNVGDTWALLMRDWDWDPKAGGDTGATWFVAEKYHDKDGYDAWKEKLLDFCKRPLEKDDLLLRLERKGDKLYPAISDDGKTWKQLAPFTERLPKSVRLGVYAINPSGHPSKPTFDHLKLDLKSPQKGGAARGTP